ncbi:helix-turn-helix transcriptional regulator [Micromonospora sp. B11E3]|uniref:helix-turn-helix domain-containing protein n=1 Tax=Micromonospora sp. B11E3 TaxID=3153562 RepID=UPI00325D7D3E
MGTASDYVLNELRLLRASLGSSQEEFGRTIGYSGSHVSSVETGGRPPTKEYMEAVDRAHDPAYQPGGEGRFMRMLRDLGKLDVTPTWLREWIELEGDGTLLRWYEPAFVPGLLQTEAYARAILAHSLLLPTEVEQRVASRLERQQILTRESPVPLVAVLDVMVLRRPTGIYLGLQGAFILATLGDGAVVAHLDHQVKAQVVDGVDDLATLQRTWEVVRGEALSRRQSLELIREAAQTWT